LWMGGGGATTGDTGDTQDTLHGAEAHQGWTN